MGPRYSDEKDGAPTFLKALAGARKIAEGWCYHHVQAVMLAIDMYAHAATGNVEYFWNKPHTAPGRHRSGDVP